MTLTANDRQQLETRYSLGYDAVVNAIADITPAEMDRTAPGEWSARQIVHHLADSETNSYLRLRKLLAEEDTLIQGYDENEWAKQGWYGGPIEPSLAVLKAVREANSLLLATLTTEQCERTGTHSHSGPGYSVAKWLQIYAEHPHDHADQIRRARRGYAE